ncbi:hypothetical protein CEUSTIGMA_g1860.t1 [Chlamydomonas eustigma]|uniref:Glycosyl transferase family 1 domain-containing protein n=1 Tax=Chlamydomonas eustigma TaxID=1157962 RepID=A0A250WUV3_9CHLO|nr:hypothetical protein CEUSTIGMA_g1860.t1 [Chlamydomonas eustigma]|eukprot:GAX74412.1 hypothetical protein CEUSTIGMA_g1860.t1 [Chlamydomonas eustigma]
MRRISIRSLLLVTVVIVAGFHFAGRIVFPPYHDSLTIVTMDSTLIIDHDTVNSNSHQSLVSVEAKQQNHDLYHQREKHNPILWMAPFFDGSGFGREASTLFLSLSRSHIVAESELWAGITQPSCEHSFESASMPSADYNELLDAHNRKNVKKEGIIVVCHSLPAFWNAPGARWKSCEPCPPRGIKASVKIGRAMVESDRYHADFVRRSNNMDEIWVPSSFSLDVLVASGVNRDKLRIVPIAVNTSLFDPSKVLPLELPMGHLIYGSRGRRGDQSFLMKKSTQQAAAVVGGDALVSSLASSTSVKDEGTRKGSKNLFWIRGGGAKTIKGLPQALEGRPFIFVSTFKWETRKGWDKLVQAYLEEFSHADNVELYILAKSNGIQGTIQEKIYDFVQGSTFGEHYKSDKGRGPTLYVIDTPLSAEDYVRFYRSADCYVIPSRGEGWGMPVTEAMSMGLPVIVTGWSGTADIVNEDVGYLIKYKLVEVRACLVIEDVGYLIKYKS